MKPHSIPTLYRGTKMRSRLEADVAFLLDRMGCEWEYEPQSFLLDDGTHYWPDFRVGKLWLWVEARGYVTEKGERQIRAFRDQLDPDDSYLVIHAGGTALTEPVLFPDGLGHETRGGICVATCGDCDGGFFYHQDESWTCRHCEGGNVFHEGQLEITAGKLHLDGQPVRDAEMGPWLPERDAA